MSSSGTRLGSSPGLGSGSSLGTGLSIGGGGLGSGGPSTPTPLGVERITIKQECTGSLGVEGVEGVEGVDPGGFVDSTTALAPLQHTELDKQLEHLKHGEIIQYSLSYILEFF